MFNILRLTLKEIMNKRILYLGLVFSFIYLLVFGIGLNYVVKDQGFLGTQFWYKQQAGYQFLTLGWYVSTFLAGALAIMMGAGSISREIESGTILSLASRPFTRRAILGGKFLAYAMVTALYSGLMAGAIAGLIYYYFSLMINPEAMVTGIFIFMLIPVVLLAVAHLGSCLMSTMATGVAAFMLFVIAIIGGFMEQIGAVIANRALVNIGVVASLIMPCDAVYRMAVEKAVGMMGKGSIINFGPFGVSSTPSVWMMVYVGVYIVIMICLAMHFLDKRDL